MAQKGPGRHDREGLSLVDVMRMVPDDEAAEAWIASVRWPDGPVSPPCDSDNKRTDRRSTQDDALPLPSQGDAESGSPSASVAPALQDSKLGYQTWALASYLMTTELKGRSSMKLHRDLRITQKSAWHLAHRIREAWDIAQGAFLRTVTGMDAVTEARYPGPMTYPCLGVVLARMIPPVVSVGAAVTRPRGPHRRPPHFCGRGEAGPVRSVVGDHFRSRAVPFGLPRSLRIGSVGLFHRVGPSRRMCSRGVDSR